MAKTDIEFPPRSFTFQPNLLLSLLSHFGCAYILTVFLISETGFRRVVVVVVFLLVGLLCYIRHLISSPLFSPIQHLSVFAVVGFSSQWAASHRISECTLSFHSLEHIVFTNRTCTQQQQQHLTLPRALGICCVLLHIKCAFPPRYCRMKRNAASNVEGTE